MNESEVLSRRKQAKREYYAKNREAILAKRKKYVESHRELVKLQKQKQHAKYKLTPKAKAVWNRSNRNEAGKARAIAFRIKNRESINARIREWKAKRRKTNPEFRIGESYRSRLVIALKAGKFKKHGKTHLALGCSFEEFKEYISAQFRPGMSWENYGDWHIDHRIPLCTAKTAEEIHSLSHHSNLQPLWAQENFSKGGRIQP